MMSYKFPYFGSGRREDFLRAKRDGFSILIKYRMKTLTINQQSFHFNFPDDHICDLL